MKILLVGNYRADKQRSMIGFAEHLSRALAKQLVTVSTLSPGVKMNRTRSGGSGNKWLGYVDKYILFPRLLRRKARENDVVHVLDQGNAIYSRFLKEKPHLVTCHDLIAIRAMLGEISEWQLGKSGKLYQQLILSALKLSKSFACVSEATQQDVHRLVGAEISNTRLIHNCLFFPYSPASVTEVAAFKLETGLREPYLLHIGNNSPYKNRTGLVQMYGEAVSHGGDSIPELVLVGPSPNDALKSSIAGSGAGDRIRLLTNKSNLELQMLYSGAYAFVFPSLYEGFGLPIIEAQACGCPVLTTARAPMTEVGGDAALYFEPSSDGSFTQALCSLDSKRDRLVEAGLLNVQRFSSQGMASGYVDLYRDLCGTGTPI